VFTCLTWLIIIITRIILFLEFYEILFFLNRTSNGTWKKNTIIISVVEDDVDCVKAEIQPEIVTLEPEIDENIDEEV